MGVHSGPLRDEDRREILSSRGAGLDIFVVAFDRSLELRWTQGLGSAEDEFAASMAVSETAGTVFFAGLTRGPATVGDPERGVIALDHEGDGEGDLFVAEISASAGAPTWAEAWPGLGGDAASGLAAGPDGEVYVVGSFATEVSDGDATYGSLSELTGGVWRLR